jgi:imidazolonepropionase-like amidohydrolase
MKRFFATAIAALSIGPAFAQTAEAPKAPPPDQWTIIQAGTLIASPGEAPRKQQSVIVKNNRIERIASGYVESVGVEGAKAKVVDLRDSYVLPGLMDAHVHLASGGGRRSEEAGADAYRMLTIVENAKKTLNAGYTTVRDVGSGGYSIFAFREGVKNGLFDGPRVYASGHTVDIGTMKEDGPGACYDVSSCKQAVRHQIEMGADWIKVYATCSGSRPCGREFAPGVFTSGELAAIIATAKTREIPVTAHAHGTAGINDVLRAGVRSVEHGSYNNEESRALFKKNGAFYIPTLSVQDNIAKDYKTATDAMKPVMEGFMDQHPKRVAAAHRAGVKIAAGSDAGVTPHGANARELYWYVKAGMTPAEAIRAATIVDADLLNASADLGSIEKGKFADIIAVGKDPLADIEALSAVSFVMANGRIVKDEKAAPASAAPSSR